MSQLQATQPAFVGLAPRKARKRQTVHERAKQLPIAQVILDVQATHLGQAFDYLIDEKLSQQVQPGVLVRVRFGARRVNGVVWGRVDHSPTPDSSLRYIERVLSPWPLVNTDMRADISAIADAFGGTKANILRLAVPPRVARIDKEQQLALADYRQGVSGTISSDHLQLLTEGLSRSQAAYQGFRPLQLALESNGFSSFVMDALPGAGHWARQLALLALQALVVGKAAVLELPSGRQAHDLSHAMEDLGLKPFIADKVGHGSFSGDFAMLSSSMPPMERYRSYLALATGRIRCAIGTRAVMYAPVEGPSLFAIVEDAAYQNADGMMPYANARGVLRLRALLHQGVFLAMSNARSSISQWEVSGLPACSGPITHDAADSTKTDDEQSPPIASGSTAWVQGADQASAPAEIGVSGFSSTIHGFPAVVESKSPWIRWFNRQELARIADPAIGARVPHMAVRVLTDALEEGPVLLSIPRDGISESLSCSTCHRQARCHRCTGPLHRQGRETPRCSWCGAAAVNWSCTHCGGERMTVIRVGAAGTAQELHGLFRDVPMVLSSPSQPGGIVEWVDDSPKIVIATPGAEPRLSGNAESPGAYRAVAILDAWTSLYALGIDARLDCLTAWMRASALCAARSAGGQVLLLGESDPILAQSLLTWNPALLAQREVRERMEAGLPPALCAACVWGSRQAVRGLLSELGLLYGPRSTVTVSGMSMPAVLGIVPIAQPRTMDTRELEATQDRVRAVIRVKPADRSHLAGDLRSYLAHHVALRQPGELRFQLDPKDLG